MTIERSDVLARVNEVACGSLFKLTRALCTALHCAMFHKFCLYFAVLTKYNRLVFVQETASRR